jgi:hypothetical protein
MGKCIIGYRRVRHAQTGAKVWWDGYNIVTRMDPRVAFAPPNSPLRRYLASLGKNEKTPTEKETALREQLIRDGVPMQRVNLLCTEDFDDIMADIMADIME